VALFDRHHRTSSGDVSSRRRSRCFRSSADRFGKGICPGCNRQGGAGRRWVRTGFIARREIGRYRTENAGELDAHIDHRRWGWRQLFSLPYIFRKRRGFVAISADSRMCREIRKLQFTAFSTHSSAPGFMRSLPFVDFSCRAWRCCLVEVVARGFALVFCKGRCSEQRTLTKSAGNRYHRHTRHFDGTAGSCVGTQSLARDHRTRALRRESFCFVLLSRAANWLS
jgi:hypothetical protein